MSQLTFPVARAGLAVPVWIGLDGKTTSALLGAGKQIASPVPARGLLDTGSDVSAVSSWVLQQLGIPVATTAVTQTAGGPVQVKLFEVSLGITDPNRPGSPWITQPDLLVMELPISLQDADVLIGLDVLLACKLLLDGPARQFTLEA